MVLEEEEEEEVEVVDQVVAGALVEVVEEDHSKAMELQEDDDVDCLGREGEDGGLLLLRVDALLLLVVEPSLFFWLGMLPMLALPFVFPSFCSHLQNPSFCSNRSDLENPSFPPYLLHASILFYLKVSLTLIYFSAFPLFRWIYD